MGTNTSEGLLPFAWPAQPGELPFPRPPVRGDLPFPAEGARVIKSLAWSWRSVLKAGWGVRRRCELVADYQPRVEHYRRPGTRREVFRLVGHIPDPRRRDFWTQISKRFSFFSRSTWLAFLWLGYCSAPVSRGGQTREEMEAAGWVSLWRPLEPEDDGLSVTLDDDDSPWFVITMRDEPDEVEDDDEGEQG